MNVKVAITNQANELYEILEWKYNDGSKIIERNFEANYKGFLLLDDDQFPSNDFSLNTDYIGPFRKTPERSYSRHTIYGLDKFGIHGENAYSFLIQDSLTVEQNLINKVSGWYEENFEGWGVVVNSEKAPFYQVELSRENSGLSVNIKDVGQGMSQALPLVTRAMMPTDSETLIILEQPELHLHPAAHANLAELFVQSVKDDINKKYLIETHSQNFLLRLRRLVAEGGVKKEDLQLYFVDFDEDSGVSQLKAIEVDDNGEVSFWPDGIFNESYEEARAIIRAQKKNRS